MPFADGRLHEASRCYVQGFYDAAVVLSVSALESVLKQRLNNEPEAHVQRGVVLVPEATRRGLLGSREMGSEPLLAATARRAIDAKNLVAHGRRWKPRSRRAPSSTCGTFLSI
jgi:hypothetical protein